MDWRNKKIYNTVSVEKIGPDITLYKNLNPIRPVGSIISNFCYIQISLHS